MNKTQAYRWLKTRLAELHSAIQSHQELAAGEMGSIDDIEEARRNIDKWREEIPVIEVSMACIRQTLNPEKSTTGCQAHNQES